MKRHCGSTFVRTMLLAVLAGVLACGSPGRLSESSSITMTHLAWDFGGRETIEVECRDGVVIYRVRVEALQYTNGPSQSRPVWTELSRRQSSVSFAAYRSLWEEIEQLGIASLWPGGYWEHRDDYLNDPSGTQEALGDKLAAQVKKPFWEVYRMYQAHSSTKCVELRVGRQRPVGFLLGCIECLRDENYSRIVDLIYGLEPAVRAP